MDLYGQKIMEPHECLGSAIVILSFLQQLTEVHMDTMPSDLLGKLLDIVVETEARKGKQCLEVLIKDKQSRLEPVNVIIFTS